MIGSLGGSLAVNELTDGVSFSVGIGSRWQV